jgi:hypothetical protein
MPPALTDEQEAAPQRTGKRFRGWPHGSHRCSHECEMAAGISNCSGQAGGFAPLVQVGGEMQSAPTETRDDCRDLIISRFHSRIFDPLTYHRFGVDARVSVHVRRDLVQKAANLLLGSCLH